MNSEISVSRPLKSRIFDYLIVALLVYYVLFRMPVVAYYVSTYISMALLVVLVVLYFFMKGNRTINLAPAALLLLPAYLVFLIDIAHQQSFSVLYTVWAFFLFVLPIFLGRMITRFEHKTHGKIIVYAIIISYLVTAITTFLGLSIFPEASRILATEGANFEIYYPYNIGGYGFIYSLVLLHPLIVGIFRKKRKPLFAIIFTVVAALCVIRSTFTMALLLFAISLIAYFLPVNDDASFKRGRIIIVFVIILVLAIFSVSFLDVLASLDFIDEKVASRIEDIVNILQGNPVQGNAGEARLDAYSESIEAILNNNLILGSRIGGEHKDGGHSFILDTFARWGIVGFVFILLFIYSFFSWYRRITHDSIVKYYALLFFGMTLVLMILNPTFWNFELGFIAPLMLGMLSEKTLKKEKK